MKIVFSPVRSDTRMPPASVSGDVLTVGEEVLDFGPLEVGAILPADAIDSTWIAGDVHRLDDGQLVVALRLTHGRKAPEQTRFPQPITVEDGAVPLPRYDEEDES